MKPRFIRQDSNKLKRLGKKWRKPKGLHSKMRNKFSGHRSNVNVGWKSDKICRGLVGKLKNVLVCSLKEIECINPETQGITISNSVGLKKRITLVNKAKERDIKILNIKNVDDYIARHVSKREQAKKAKKKESPKPKEVAKEKPKEKPKAEEKTQPEIKEDKSKEEVEKLLTKRE